MSARESCSWLYATLRVLLWWLFRALFRLEVHGQHYVPAEGPCILASNHASFLDPPVLGLGARHRVVRFMARDTLYRNGLAAYFLSRLHAVPIDRTKGDIAALRRGLKVLEEGGVLALFPEGTRTLDGRLQPPKGGIGFLIAKARVPVIPAYVEGTFAALPKGARRLRFVRIRVRFGTPIMPEEWLGFGERRESYDRIAQLVMQRIAALQREPEREDSPPAP